MKRLLLVIFLLLLPIMAFASDGTGTWTLGYGVIRADGNITHYHTLTADYEFSPHFELNGGTILSGLTTPYDTDWFGASVVENEDLLYGSIGVIKISRQTPTLTSPFQFYLVFGLRYHGTSISYRHISNGGTGGHNGGEDLIVFAYTF